MESPSPMQVLGINPFPSKWSGCLGRFCALIEERANENREMTVEFSYVKL